MYSGSWSCNRKERRENNGLQEIENSHSNKDGIEYRDGYKFDACFSNGELFEMGVYKNAKGQWIISGLNTGLMVTYGKTRVDAVKKFQDVYLSKFERIVFTNEYYSSSPSCHENFYKHQTAEFQAMLKEGAK